MITNMAQAPVFSMIPLHLWWSKLAYRHKMAEFLMYFMFVSGLLLWERLSLDWHIGRWLLLSHMFVGATIFTLVVGVFWSSPRQLFTKSNKHFLKLTGRLVEVLLFACVLSGFYLLIFGNTGNQLCLVIEQIHFYSSWLLAPLVARHALRWSIINVKRFVS